MSALITPELVSLDENLGESRFDVIRSLAQAVTKADRASDTAEELGYDFKVEPQGSSGGDKLTAADIAEADAVVFAVDVPVRGRERFAGKPYVEYPVKHGIDEPKKIIEEALAVAADPKGRRVAGAGSSSEIDSAEAGAPWDKRIYKALMVGVSYMIPFVAAGGIIVALGFDLGGPINKAAYLFATTNLSTSTSSQEVMAAVMIAGMVPPLAMALATVIRPKLFSDVERQNGKAAWLLGASFISEGAIPFATADPLRVIPSSVVGAAVAGAVSMAAGVSSPAPHGGIWVSGLSNNILMFILAALIGTLVSALIYIVLKSGSSQKTA